MKLISVTSSVSSLPSSSFRHELNRFCSVHHFIRIELSQPRCMNLFNFSISLQLKNNSYLIILSIAINSTKYKHYSLEFYKIQAIFAVTNRFVICRSVAFCALLSSPSVTNWKAQVNYEIRVESNRLTPTSVHVFILKGNNLSGIGWKRCVHMTVG